MHFKTTAMIQDIATNIGRIATALETLAATASAAPKPEEVDIGDAVSKAMDSIAKSSPVFGAALKQMETAMLSAEVKG